jgi:hypothetical protein
MVNIHSGFLPIVAHAKRFPALCPGMKQGGVASVTRMRQSRTIDET